MTHLSDKATGYINRIKGKLARRWLRYTDVVDLEDHIALRKLNEAYKELNKQMIDTYFKEGKS